MEPERERGPLEKELYEKLRMEGLSDPAVLEADLQGAEFLDTSDWLMILIRGKLTHMEAILRLARELDERSTE